MINSHVRLVSISGGMKDDLIAESLTSSDLPHIRHLSSTGLDRVWLEADHKAIVWCNQLVRQTSRIFFAFGEDPEGFRNNVDSVIENHFEGPQQSLAPLKAGNENVNSLETCLENGKCFKNGFVSFTKEKDFTVVVVRFVSSFEVISILEDESSCKIRTRYLTINCF
uniref:Uncharacterized protein n=1 Tax=Panagrolaimus sp. JU765 TaxID=591449 RepID=A0AC34QCT3_9BILA